MRSPLLLAVLLILAVTSYVAGRRRAIAVSAGRLANLKALPSYHGVYAALWAVVPGICLALFALSIEPFATSRLVLSALPREVREMEPGRRDLLLAEARRLSSLSAEQGTERPREMTVAAERFRDVQHATTVGVLGSVLSVGLVGVAIARRRISPTFAARAAVERVVRASMACAATIAVLTTFGIVLSLVAETARFFERVPITDFLFGLRWSPQTALRADQVGATGSFGAIPLFAGTLLITGIAMCVAVPLGLFSAVFTSEYAGPRARAIVKPVLEVLAGIPTVVYGFFAALTVAPMLREVGAAVGLDVASESALAAGCVMGIMIVPFVSSLSDDVMNAVPQSLRDGAYALGATRSETIRQIVLPAALPGIAGAVLLAISRAIGETMIVVMAAGLAANLTMNPFAAVTTVTVQIVTLLVGDQEFDSAKTLSAFALGLVLFVVTLALNVAAMVIVRRYREQYE